ncbi:hypothetical protein CRE_10012 [Caenorhabditis remanei]|uniref:Uncharacterized protein n=1 Tax=Caenorhabditis remanei TaxID=31234 RepID=E3M6S9_CAERE|nr:hypothetical protein CRE_10012 [Caenorhabditis remanei]
MERIPEEGGDNSPYSSDVGTNLNKSFPDRFQVEDPASRQKPNTWWFNWMKRNSGVCLFLLNFLLIIALFAGLYMVYKFSDQHQQDSITPHNEIKKQEYVKYDKAANMDEVFKKRLEEFDAKMHALDEQLYALGAEMYAFEIERMNGTNEKNEPKEHHKLGEHDFSEKETAEEPEVEEDEMKSMDEEDFEDEEYDEYNEEKEREAMGNSTRNEQEEKTGSDVENVVETPTEPYTSADQQISK